ncbi:MAG TPA: RDD family protein [Bacilli bacterium]|nr:RDD family protein [Bacilli bacterium]HPS18852.1 RDD family protein [Bacilli bacterium]
MATDIQETKVNEINVEYYTPPFYRRVLANVIDVIFFLLSFIGLFIGVREIATSTSEYQENMITMATIKLESCLFVPNTLPAQDVDDYIVSTDKDVPDDIKVITDIVSVISDDYWFGVDKKNEIAQAAISGFHNYCQIACTNEDYQAIMADYESFMLSDELVDDYGVHYFVKVGENNIIVNVECTVPSNRTFFKKGYAPYIDEHAQGYLVTSIPDYYECTKYLSNILTFVEIPISYLLSGLLIYLLPVLIFRRGRMTFGKAIYRIGSLDSHFLSPKIGRTMARFAIFYFAELILALFTLGIPFIISFSLMAFSKKKQGFPDYMLNIVEVDGYRTKIFMSKEEIALKGIDTHAKPVDFKVRQKL